MLSAGGATGLGSVLELFCDVLTREHLGSPIGQSVMLVYVSPSQGGDDPRQN